MLGMSTNIWMISDSPIATRRGKTRATTPCFAGSPCYLSHRPAMLNSSSAQKKKERTKYKWYQSQNPTISGTLPESSSRILQSLLGQSWPQNVQLIKTHSETKPEFPIDRQNDLLFSPKRKQHLEHAWLARRMVKKLFA